MSSMTAMVGWKARKLSWYSQLLEYYRVAAADAVSGVQQREGAAYHDGRVALGGHEYVRTHAGGGGLAVGTGYAQRVLIVAHDGAPGLGALEHGDAACPGLHYFAVVVAHGGGAHHELYVRGDVHRPVPYLDLYAQGAQMLRLFALGHVGAVYHQPHAREHFGQRSHAHAAYTYQVPAHAGPEIILKICHNSSCPVNQIRALKISTTTIIIHYAL